MRAALWIGLALSVAGCGRSTTAPASKAAQPAKPHPAATWPWPHAEVTHPYKGVIRWVEDTSRDGTVVELIRFDFRKNPRLRFELYDQDQDDPIPFDDKADYFPNGVGRIVKHLNRARGKVVAAWNGPFFGYDRSKNPPHGYAHHVAPVVVAGVARYNVGLVRWGFGVKVANGRPTFHTAYRPNRDAMARVFDYGASGLQCLIRDGKVLNPEQGGTIQYVDQMRTSRTSMGWSRDSRFLFLLVVDAPGTETSARLAVKYGRPQGPGWTLADLRGFWSSLKVWGAVNNDGGSVTQFALLRPDGQYDVMPPQIAAPRFRLVLGPDFSDAPPGGTLMTWFVWQKSEYLRQYR